MKKIALGSAPISPVEIGLTSVDLQGHRGCRGVLPENTIEGFVKALETGVTTLEMDVVISKDKQVIVSHEAYFSHEISTAPFGKRITKSNEKKHNMYALTYEEIKAYTVGSKPHPRFPFQQQLPTYKPSLEDVILAVDSHAIIHGLRKPIYNIEIKREPELDGIFNPPAKEFAWLVVEQIRESFISDRVCLQSFDIETLQAIKRIAPDLTIALLVEDNTPLEENLKALGFTPDKYGPSFELITQDVVEYCRARNILITPWTVNEESDLLRMLEFGVDGIITDYPQRFKAILDQRAIHIK